MLIPALERHFLPVLAADASHSARLRRQLGVWTWQASGGDYALTLTSLANGAGRMGEKIDLGQGDDTFPGLLAFYLVTKFALAPTAANALELYWAPSYDNATFPGHVTGADAALPATVADNKAQLDFLGTLSATADTNAQAQLMGVHTPVVRYGAPVLVNAAGVALSGSSEDHTLVAVRIQ